MLTREGNLIFKKMCHIGFTKSVLILNTKSNKENDIKCQAEPRLQYILQSMFTFQTYVRDIVHRRNYYCIQKCLATLWSARNFTFHTVTIMSEGVYMPVLCFINRPESGLWSLTVDTAKAALQDIWENPISINTSFNTYFLRSEFWSARHLLGYSVNYLCKCVMI